MNRIRQEAAAASVRARRRDPAVHLDDARNIATNLEAAFEDGDPHVIAAALGDVARSRGMTAVAAKSGLGRGSLYKALSRDGNPDFATVLSVLEALGLRLHPVERDPGAAAAQQHRSMKEEARLTLRDAAGRKADSRDLASIVRSHFGPDKGVDLDLPTRVPGREPPTFN